MNFYVNNGLRVSKGVLIKLKVVEEEAVPANEQ